MAKITKVSRASNDKGDFLIVSFEKKKDNKTKRLREPRALVEDYSEELEKEYKEMIGWEYESYRA